MATILLHFLEARITLLYFKSNYVVVGKYRGEAKKDHVPFK